MTALTDESLSVTSEELVGHQIEGERTSASVMPALRKLAPGVTVGAGDCSR